MAEYRIWLQPQGWDSKDIHNYPDPYSRRYLLDLEGTQFDVVLSIGATSHEIYKAEGPYHQPLQSAL